VLKVALLGAGGIGSFVADATRDGRLPNVALVAVAGSSAASLSAAALAQRHAVPHVAVDALLAAGADVILEAAGATAARAFLPAAWRAGIATVVMSVGALLDPTLEGAWRVAKARGVKVILPSGGIAGLDGVRAIAAGGRVHGVVITTTKSPASLRGAPYLSERGIELPDDRIVTVFDGSAREAVRGFPANANVAAALAFAGNGPDATRVRICSDPSARRTQQVIDVAGDVATLRIEVATEMTPGNARTSFLSAASAVAALRELAGR
jgi:aspartate dehydrogenase